MLTDFLRSFFLSFFFSFLFPFFFPPGTAAAATPAIATATPCAQQPGTGWDGGLCRFRRRRPYVRADRYSTCGGVRAPAAPLHPPSFRPRTVDGVHTHYVSGVAQQFVFRPEEGLATGARSRLAWTQPAGNTLPHYSTFETSASLLEEGTRGLEAGSERRSR